jgi:predicted alpha/beta superfamily hydrolase
MPEATQHTLTGEFRTHARFRSRFLPHERAILVYLPPGYKQRAARRYPVLYLHDGQNVFDKATSFGEEWHVDETAQRLIEAGQIEPLIVVAIYNTGEHRIDEYTPTKVAEKGGGNADNYGRMLVEEIKPLIDRKYKTLPSAASTGLGGSSLGGLVTIYLALRYPTAFNRLAVLSPSVWWDNKMIVHEIEKLPSKLPLRIWLDAGTGEGPNVVADVRAFRDALVAKGWVPDHDLRYIEAEGAEHNETAWGSRVGDVLKWLYPATKGQGTKT